MPRSKHRHKGSSGKAWRRKKVDRNGPLARAWASATLPLFDAVDAEMQHTPVAYAPEVAATVMALAFNDWPQVARAVSKQDVMYLFLKHERRPFGRNLATEDVESALAYLAGHGFALVDGDQIIIPDRFMPTAG